MKILFSALYKAGSVCPGKDGPVLMSSASELTSLGYFQQRPVGEMMVFFSRQFAKGAKDPGQRSSVKEQGFLCHVYVSTSGIVAACFADEEYPTRVAFGYLSKLCEDFVQATGGNLGAASADGAFNAVFQATHKRLLAQFQDPAQADQLTRIMSELEQTKLVRAPLKAHCSAHRTLTRTRLDIPHLAYVRQGTWHFLYGHYLAIEAA